MVIINKEKFWEELIGIDFIHHIVGACMNVFKGRAAVGGAEVVKLLTIMGSGGAS